MEGRNLFFLMSIILLLIYTFLNLPSPLSHTTDQLFDCTTYSPWCSSKKPFFLRQPENSKNHYADFPNHPLDPLTIGEIQKVKKIVNSIAEFRMKGCVLHSVVLEEPEKEVVLNWRKGLRLPPRKAAVVARALGVVHVLSVDIETGRVTRRETGSYSGYPIMTIEDMITATSAPFASSDFNRSIIQRGVDLADLACLPISTGWYGKIEEKRRVIKVQCYTLKDTINFYMRPLEGLTVLLDLDTQQVIEIIDEGKSIPIPKAANTDYRYSRIKKNTQKINLLKPISIEQPNGPSFTIENNHLVKWANWEFHLKPDPRAGVIISRAMVQDPDTGKMRNVMYKGFTSELFVPYMDPSDAWYFKTYMDAGEYGFGLQAMPLDPLNDCPRNAYYMDGVFVAADGTPYVRSNMICVFERYAGDIGWRHAECPITGLPIREVRPKVTLVVRMAASVANYDYIVDWEFQNDGLIRPKGSDNITNDEGIPQLLNWWRARGTQFPKLSRMVKDVLAIQGSSVASEAAFSAARFQIGDHRYSLAEDSLEISVLFRDWINAERRNQGLPKLDSQFELFIDSAIGCGSDDGMELQDRQRALPRPVVDYGQSIAELEKGFTGLYNY